MIELTRETDGAGPPHEWCCFCWEPTPYWHTPKDVAVCQECAMIHTPEEVPTKEEWCAEARKRMTDLGLIRCWSAG